MPSCVNCKHFSCGKVEGKCRPEQKTCGLTNKRVTADFFRKNDCNKWVDMIDRSRYKKEEVVNKNDNVFICQETDKGVVRKPSTILKVTPHFFDCGNLRFKKGGNSKVIGFLFSNIGKNNPRLWVENKGDI